MTRSPDRDPRRLWIAVTAIAGLAVTLVVTLALKGGDNGEGLTDAAFEPVYEELEQRREAAGVSTMGDPADPEAHLHPTLTLYAEGERIPIPVNIGIDPTKPADQMASLHTHETDGTIHVEGMSEARLGQFFEIWGVPFSETKLGPYEVDGKSSMQMWVDGQPSDQFGQLWFEDGQRIIVAYGTPEELARAEP